MPTAGIENNILFGGGMKLTPSSSRDIQDMQRTPTSISHINHTGNPEGAVSANPSSVSRDPVSGDMYQKLTGTGNTGWSAPLNNQLNYYISPQIDFTSAGVVDLFTISNAGNFFPMFVGVVMDNVVTFLNSAQGNIGYNAPTYDNVFNGWQEFANVTNGVYFQDTSLPGLFIPGGSNLKMDITVPESAVTALGRMVFIGFTF